jgi:Ion channel
VYSLKVFDNTWKKTRHRNFISKSYIMELVLISIHPLPYWDPQFSVSSINLTDKKKYVLTYYRASHVLLAFMFVRMLFLLRTIFNYSMFTDLYSKRLCQTYGFTANVRFTFKCMIIRNPGLTVVCTLTASTFILAYILRIFEIEYYRSINQIDFDNYFQAIWVIVVTMTTVGFGDLVPYSYIGRIIIMVTSFWGAFLISLVIVSVSKIFELTRN